MRFEALTLERYGSFSGRQLQFAKDAKVHVVHGANEAGKTSALAAIADLLFGFGHTTPYGFTHNQSLLRIGATLRFGDGSGASLRRRKGRGITVLDENDHPLSEDPLAARVGTIDRQTFLEEFGLTAAALRSGGAELMKAGGRLAESLAASSAGLSALARLRTTLEADADALFRPTRAASKDFYVAYDRHRSAEQRLRESVVTVDAWKAANRTLTEAIEAHAALQQEEARLRGDLGRRERARRTRPKLTALAQVRAELAAYADMPAVAGDAVAQWQRMIEDEARLREQLQQLDDDDAQDRTRVEALAIDEPVLSANGAIEALQQRIGAIAKAREDLPRRVGARRNAHEGLAQAARRVGLATVEALLDRQPMDSALARVRELSTEGRRITERLREADAALADARTERERLAVDDFAATTAADPVVLKRRLDVFADVPLDADRLRRERAAIERVARKLGEEAAALEPSIGDLEAVVTKPLPSSAEIAQAKALADAIDQEMRDNAGEAAAAADQIRAAEREIARLAAQGAVSTWADLHAARQTRADAFGVLKERLAGPASERRPAFDAARAAALAVDTVTDRLLADVKRATLSAAAQDRLREAQDRQVAGAEAHDRLIDAQAAARQGWSAMWTASGLTPREPARMQGWRERLAKLLETRDALGERRSEMRALAQRLEGCGPGLRALAQDVGVTVPVDAALELVHREIAAAVDALQAAWTEARKHEVAVHAAERAMRTAEAALERVRHADEAWRAAWPAAVGDIGLPAEAGFGETDAALAIWQSVPADKRAYERESQSVVGIERDLRAFADDVGGLAQRIAPDLADRSPDEALAQMARRLSAAREAHQKRGHLVDAVESRRPKRAALCHKLDQIAAILSRARQQLGAGDDEALPPLLGQHAARNALQARSAGLLADLSAEGLDEAGLLAEQADLDLPGLDASIVDLDQRLTRLTHEEIGAAHAEVVRATAAVQELAGGRDAEAAACDKEEAAAEIRDIAERWMVRAAAAKLAALAIDRHRARVQDPLVARASELFAIVTGGAFSGLTTQYKDDKDTPILVGRRADGSTLEVDGMSEGTRDQLYLVLRLALLERHTLEPLPFIGDDLLASFDEARTAQTLDVLAAFGEKRQVILFTHHAHVAEIARERLGERVDLIAL